MIVIKGTGQRLVPLDFTNVSIDVYSFSYLEGLMGHHDEFLCLWLLLLRAQASSGIFHCSAGHGWVRPSIAAFVDVSSSHQRIVL